MRLLLHITPFLPHMHFPDLSIHGEMDGGEPWMNSTVLHPSFVLILKMQRRVFGAMGRFTFKLLFLVCNENYFGVTCRRLRWSLKQFIVVYGRLLEHEDHEKSFKIPKEQIACFCALVWVFTLRGEGEVLAHWCQKLTFNYVEKSLQSLSLWSIVQ